MARGRTMCSLSGIEALRSGCAPFSGDFSHAVHASHTTVTKHMAMPLWFPLLCSLFPLFDQLCPRSLRLPTSMSLWAQEEELITTRL